LAALAGSLVSCGGEDGANASDSKGSERVKVGFANPFSGPLGTQGVKFETAIRLAQKQINDNGGIRGKKLDLVVRDTETDAEVATGIAEELMDDGITAVVSGGGSGSVFAMLDVTVPAEAVLVVGTARTVSLARESNDGLFFRPGSTTLDEAAPLAREAIGDGYTKVAIIMNTHPYTSDFAAEFQNAFDGEACDGGTCEVVTVLDYPVSVDSDTFDFKPLVEEALDSGAEAIVFSSYPPDANALFDAAADAGYEGHLYTTAAAGNENLTAFLTDEEARRVKWVALEDASGRSAKFVREQWVDSGNSEKDFNGPVHSNYDAMFVLGLALAHADSKDGRVIAESLREVANPPGTKIYAGEWAKALEAIEAGEDINYVGVASDVDFDELGNIEIGTVVKGYDGGETVVLE
jgi:ABC-type branched-subunit amino acid transport system substrate-binding protein